MPTIVNSCSPQVHRGSFCRWTCVRHFRTVRYGRKSTRLGIRRPGFLSGSVTTACETLGRLLPLSGTTLTHLYPEGARLGHLQKPSQPETLNPLQFPWQFMSSSHKQLLFSQDERLPVYVKKAKQPWCWTSNVVWSSLGPQSPAGVNKNKTNFIIKLRCYFPLSLCWHWGWVACYACELEQGKRSHFHLEMSSVKQ